MRWWVFPGRDPLDVAQYRQGLIRQGRSPEAAYIEAEKARKHTFVSWAKRRAMGPAGRPTEAEIRDWFSEDRPLRGVVVLTGPDCAGEGRQLLGIDVDPGRGGDAAPWSLPVEEGGPTLLAQTPSGGLHAYHVLPNPSEGGERVPNSEGKDDPSSGGKQHKGIADGVDIRGDGGLLAAPSGEVATPGRYWLRDNLEAPTAFPVDEWRRRLTEREAWRTAEREAVRRVLVLGDDDDPDAIPDTPPVQRAFATACCDPAPRGTRQGRMKALVGMLARLGPLPGDVVAAAVHLLRDWCEAEGLPSSVERSLEAGWEAQLVAPSRSLAFALEVTAAWSITRNVPAATAANPPWPEDKVEDTTRSLWRTATAREAARPTHSPAPKYREAAQEEAAQIADASEEDGSPLSGGIFEPPVKAAATVASDDELSDTYIDRRQQISRVTGRGLGTLDAEDVARALLPTLRKKYGAQQFRDKLNTPILSCATLPPWQVITRNGIIPDTSNPFGHGFGPEIDVAFAGGLRPGQLILLGAKTAKAGKTAAADQLMDGLLLRSLDVLAKIARGEPTKEMVVVRYDFSEMGAGDLTDRQLGRWLGIDSTTFRRGDQAHLAPGILRRAPGLHLTPKELAAIVIAAGEQALEEGRLADLRDLRIMPEIDGLPGRSDPQYTVEGKAVFKPLDYQTGALLLRKIVEQIKIHRRLLALQWGIPEEQICPLIFVDPIQRYQGSGEGAVEALDGFAKALKDAAIALPCLVVATSDTTKDNATGAAKRTATDKEKGKDSRNQGEKVAGTLRGSYAGTSHAPDLTLMIEREDDDEEVKPGVPIRVRLCFGVNRWLARAISIPLWFDPETGRYTPRAEDPAPPTAPNPDDVPDEPDAHDLRASLLRDAGLSPNEAQTVAFGVADLPVEQIALLVLTADGAPSKASTIGGYFEAAARKWGIEGRNAAARLPLVIAHARALLDSQ